MCNPIIKWVGGKRQLLPIIKQMMPKKYGTYYEPFFGGGALFFNLQPERSVINDFNHQLVDMYKAVRACPADIMKILDGYQNSYNELNSDDAKTEYYYELREKFNEKIRSGVSDVEMAALLIFLNKAGFNALYRVNKSGKYNVPSAHKKHLSLYSPENFKEAANALERAEIHCGDFADALVSAQEGDFVFIDSPYYDTFDSYQAGGFSEADHKRLASVFKDLSARNVKCMLTNSNTDFIKDLYKGFRIRIVPVKRLVNSDASNRTGEEVIITNYTAKRG